jgi:hypothetical protein
LQATFLLAHAKKSPGRLLIFLLSLLCGLAWGVFHPVAASEVESEPPALESEHKLMVDPAHEKPAETNPATQTTPASPESGKLLEGRVSQTGKPSPLLYGHLETIPPGTKVDLTIMGNLNSELSQKGDEILARVGCDIGNGQHVLLPGGWYMHGLVTEVEGQRRLGRDGYVEVEFDKLVSPDGDIELPFKAKVSTKDGQLKAVAKTALIDSGYISVGAIGGSLLSVQLTGIPVAIATHGISVGVGAAVGGTLGAVGALKRKGSIRSFFPGDQMKLVTAEAITLPGFDPKLLPSAKVSKVNPEINLWVTKATFGKDPLGDKLSRLLSLDVTIHNDTSKEYSFFDLAVLSDHNQRYFPHPAYLQLGRKRVLPHSRTTTHITFSVDNPKYKYWLVLLDRSKREEIARTQVN